MRRPRDAIVALALGAFAALAAALLFQRRYYADGPVLVEQLSMGAPVHAYPLYLPTGRLLRGLSSGLGIPMTAERALQALSVFGAALAASAGFFAFRRLGSGAPASAATTLLLLASPGALFFVTTIEPHGFHFAAAVLAFALACGARAGTEARASVSVSLGLLLAAGTHGTGVLLAPGLAAWAFVLGRERGARWGWRHAILFAAPWAVGALAALGVVSHGFREFQRLEVLLQPHLPLFLERMGARWRSGEAVAEFGPFLAQGFALPAGLLFAGGVAGAAALPREARGRLAAILLAVAPYLLVLGFWGYAERGAYLIPVYPLLAALAAGFVARLSSFPPSPRRAALLLGPLVAFIGWTLGGGGVLGGVCLLVSLACGLAARGDAPAPGVSATSGARVLLVLLPVQAAFAIGGLRDYNREDPLGDWFAAVRETVPRDTLVLTWGFQEPSLLRWKGGFEAVDVAHVVQMGNPLDPREATELFVVRARETLASGRAVFLDARALPAADAHPGMAKFFEALRRAFEWEPVERGALHGHFLRPREDAGGG